jgi:signal transduction histidine kinase
VDLAAYRIVQESLTNAVKHAPGSTVRMTLQHRDGELVIELDNDLVPDAPAAHGTCTGLLGLGERAGAVGGTVEAGPQGRTWSVRAALPAPVPVGVSR